MQRRIDTGGHDGVGVHDAAQGVAQGLAPLRERRDDIPALVEHFVTKHAQRTGRRIERIDDGVLSALQQYDWP